MFKSYICITQHDITDCAAACLATIARTHKLKIPISVIRQYAGTDKRGTNVLGIVAAAQKLGFEAKGVRANWETLARLPLPAIAHILQDGLLHFVVIHQVSSDRIIIADPGRGIITYTKEQFAAIWSGVLVLLLPGAAFRAGDHRVSVWRRYLRLLAPHGFLLAEALMISTVLMVSGLGISFYLQILVDKVLIEKHWGLLNWLSVGLIGLIIGRGVLNFGRGMLLAYLGRKVDVSLMLEYYRHVLRLPLSFFETRQTGEIISRFNDATKIRQLLSGSTLTILVDAATILAVIVVLCFYSLSLALLSAGIIPISIGVACLINRPLGRAQRQTMEASAQLQSHLIENINGAATLKACGAESLAVTQAEPKLIGLLRHIFRTTLWGITAQTAGEIVSGIGIVAVLWAASSRVIQGTLTIGQMISFYSILLFMLQPMLRLFEISRTLQDAMIATDRLGEVLDLSPESSQSTDRLSQPAELAEIRVDGVTFQYGTRAPVLRDLSFNIPPRSTVALVGSSGGGKTTLAKLLLRFYDPAGGRITIGGHDLRDMNHAQLRSRIGYVPQDTRLFNGTIEENLRLADPSAPFERISNAVRDVGLAEFVDGLPQRYQTHIGEYGLTLSGGQRQRLVIARALVQNPQILILDEATSNLDQYSERAIRELIGRLRNEMTIIIIAHRLSTVINADQIVVIEDGKLIEKGTHTELIRSRSRYADLWSAQFSEPEMMTAIKWHSDEGNR